MAAKHCMICGTKIGALSPRIRCSDGYVCGPCAQRKGILPLPLGLDRPTKSMTLAELEAFSRQANDRLEAIKNFKSIYSPDDRRIYFNDNTKQFIVAPKSKFSYKPSIMIRLSTLSC